MGRGAREAAEQQHAAEQLIQQLWAENERLKAALQKSMATTKHTTAQCTKLCSTGRPGAYQHIGEVPTSPCSAAVQMQLTPQQQKQALGDLLTRLQQESQQAFDEDMELQVGCRRAASAHSTDPAVQLVLPAVCASCARVLLAEW
jgi:hypothetical protein